MAQFNPYSGNYADFSQRLGQSIDRADQEAQERIERQYEAERRAMQTEMQQMQLAQMKQAQYESLVVPADTGIVGADQYIQKASRNLVDMQSNLVNEYKAGNMTADDFAQRAAVIKSQVPAIASAKETLTGFQNNYAKLLQEGKISAADNGESARLYQAMQDGAISIEAGEDGNLMMVGEEINVPLSQINRIPQPIPKAAPMSELVQAPLGAIGDAPWDPEAVYKTFDNLFTDDSVQNERMLKSIAVDNLQMPLERANQMATTPLADDDPRRETGAQTELEAYVETQMLNETKKQYDANQLKREKARIDQEYKQAQINASRQRVNRGMTPAQQNRLNQISGIADSYTKNYSQLENLFQVDENGMAMPKSQDSITAINQVLKNFGGHNIEEIVYEEPKEVGGASWYNPFSWGDKSETKEGEFLIYRKGAKSPTPATYSDLLQVIGRTQFGLDSPFKTSRSARRAAHNKKTKAAHAARTSAQWDERRDDKKTYTDLAISAAKAIPGAALLGTAGAAVQDFAGAAQGKGVGKVRDKALKAGIKAISGSAKAAAKATGAVGLALAAKDIADTFNKVQYQGMTPEEQQKRRTITAAQRRGKK